VTVDSFAPHMSYIPGMEIVVGIDAETARKEEEEMMLRDANQWLNAGCYTEQPHPKTGAYALHVAAAKGYIKVIKYGHSLANMLDF